MVTMREVKNRLMYGRKTPSAKHRRTAGQDYETTWFCKRLSGNDTFPDGRKVPVCKWKTLKPIWIKLGKGLSWANAITFGPALEQLYDAADSFGAKEIVWLEPKSRGANSRYFQDTQFGEKREGTNDA